MAQEERAGIIGISLTGDQLRMVEGVRHDNAFQVMQMAQGRTRHPFNFDSFTDKRSARRFAEDITRLYQTQPFKLAGVAFSLGSEMVMVKKLPVDTALNTEQLQQHVQWEVQQFANSPLKEYVVDYEHLESPSNGSVKEILVVVVRKKIVQFLREVFKHTDLKLHVIDVDIFSAHRAVQLNYDYRENAKVGLIDVEESKVHFSILRGKNFFLTQEVQSREDQTEELEGDAMSRLISKELRRIILDHQLGKRVEDLNEIYLYGEAVEDTLLEELQNTFDVRIDRANPFRKIRLVPQAGQDAPQPRTERYLISVGAALRGMQ